MVLLVVDTQELITNSKLYHFQEFESSVKALLDAARENEEEKGGPDNHCSGIADRLLYGCNH